MKLSQFKLKIPDELVAQYPTTYRDESRMLVLHRRTGEVEHKMITDIINYFDDGDEFIFNDTKVFPARLFGNKERTGAHIEVFLLRELNPQLRYWDVLVDPARKIRIGNKLFFDDSNTIVAEVIDNTTSRGRTLRFLSDYTGMDFRKRLFELGKTPLPSYINRAATEEDAERYQTIFAAKEGAVAAPASGLHFSKTLLKRLEIRGIDYDFITSHIGLGIFKDIEVEDLTKHKMESEQIEISESLAEKIDTLHERGSRICAIGSDVMRALETVVGTNGHIKSFKGWTNKFIYPPYDFTVANAFLTNFYFSESSQLIMAAAFGGYEQTMAAYQSAIEEGYRFGDYGDAMLIID